MRMFQYSLSMDVIRTLTALFMLHGDVLSASRQEQMDAARTATDMEVENIYKLAAKLEESDRRARLR